MVSVALTVLGDGVGEDVRGGRAVCPYCGVGCVLDVEVENNRVTKVRADAAVAPNYGMMCPKGALLSRVYDDPARLMRPMIRWEKGGALEAVSWEVAIGYVAKRLGEVRARRGGDGLAWYGSGQLDTEASYVFTKLFKGFLGSNHTDTNSRLCMSSAVAGYKHVFGADGPPTCYDDIEQADTFFILGANMAANHPVLFNRVRRRRATDENVRIIVVDPRETRTATYADVHVPVAVDGHAMFGNAGENVGGQWGNVGGAGGNVGGVGGDLGLLWWVMRRLVELDQVDYGFLSAHTEGWQDYLDGLLGMDAGALQRASGVERAVLDAVVDAMVGGRRVLSFYCMGANQSVVGTEKNAAIIAMQLMLGQVGKPGCGPFSLTGQPNAMGGREVGYLCGQLPGYRSVENAGDRGAVEAAWGLARGSIGAEPGHAAVGMFEAVGRGEIEALWVACTNPAVSMPDSESVKRALAEVPLLIVQDITMRSETAGYADVLLPACQWGEKVGTMTNSERLAVRSEQFLEPAGEAKPDWWIAAQVGRAMGFDGFDFAQAGEVWDEYRKLTAGRVCDQSGMTNERLEAGGLRWPCRDETDGGTARRYVDGVFATGDGRAWLGGVGGGGVKSEKLKVKSGGGEGKNHRDTEAQRKAGGNVGGVVLTTGRVAGHWHTRTKSGLVAELARQEPEPFLEIHPADALALGIDDGAWCVVENARGGARAKARVTTGIRRGVVFATFHFGDEYADDSNVNVVTGRAVDAVSLQPGLKSNAVRVRAWVGEEERELVGVGGGDQAGGDAGGDMWVMRGKRGGAG